MNKISSLLTIGALLSVGTSFSQNVPFVATGSASQSVPLAATGSASKSASLVATGSASKSASLVATHSASQTHPPASPALYTDSSYQQDYSIRYYPDASASALRTAVSDRNGNIRILAGNSILSPRAGRLLYPGTLVADRSYLPLFDRKVQGVCVYQGQLVYLDDQALFSNAWAGKLYVSHKMPGARLLSAGEGGQFLISDGQKIALIGGDSLLWTGIASSSASSKAVSAKMSRSSSASSQSPTLQSSSLSSGSSSSSKKGSPTSYVSSPLLDIRYEPANQRFWLLSAGSLAYFSPLSKKSTSVFHGEGLTCFTLQDNKILIGTHNGYIELALPSLRPLGPVHRRLPATDLTVIESIGDKIWFGSTNGAFAMQRSTGQPEGQSAGSNAAGNPEDGGSAAPAFSYFASERWIPGNKVTSIAAGPDHSVLVLTDKGLGKICFQPMSLEQKAMYYEAIVRQRHIRYGYYSDYSIVERGDVSTAAMGPHDSDNLWTSMYMAGELFRYLATHDQEAKQNYRESFDAMERLFTLSGIPGLFGRCIERTGIANFKDEVRKNIESYWYPGYAHTPSSWHHSPDKEWDWRGSSSSDQAVGQYFALTLVAQYSDDTALQHRAIRLIDQLTGYILDNDLKLIDVDGRPTLWGLWGPEYVNRFPDMVGDKKLYSSNIIAFLQTAYHFTGKEKYKAKAMELLYKDHYLKNLTMPVSHIGPAPDTADAWCKELSGGWNNSDDEMYFLAYWGLYPYALDTTLQTQYREAIRDHWNYKRPAKDGLWNLMYGVLTDAKEFDLDPTIWELKKMPLDLINWSVYNSGRKDLVFIGANIREEPTRDVLPPDERPQNKHNRNLFDLDDTGGKGNEELGGGDVYLLPYWMGRYFGVISAPIDNQTSSLPE